MIDLSGVTRAEAVIVTLEDVSWLLSHVPQLVELDLLDGDEPPPWIATCFDLETICATLEFPAQLTLYLDARRRLEARVASGDELNLWMLHLLRKLEFPPDVDMITLPGEWTENVDRFFMFGHGVLPKMPLASNVRRTVERADRARRPGHLAETERLIGEDQATRLPEPAAIIGDR